MSDIATTQIFSNGETGITATKMNNIIGQASIQTSFVSGQPLASSVGVNDQYLLLTSGGTYARVPNSTLVSSVSGSLTPAGVGQAGIVNALSGKSTDYIGGDNACHSLLYATGRTINAVGNPSFEVDQRQCFGAVTNVANGVFGQDRWIVQTGGTMKAATQAQSDSIIVPGTSFRISQNKLTCQCTTTESTLGANDFWLWEQNIEGPLWRELQNDVTSISLMASTNVAGLKFTVFLRSSDSTASLVKLCTLPTTAWTLIQLPNIPKPTSGSFPLAPGGIAYSLGITVACGSTYTAPAADVWQNGNFLGAPGMSNLFSAVNNYLLLGFVQHEPGPVCTTLIDKPFSVNYDECQRYYCKSYDYSTAVGTTTWLGSNLCITTLNSTVGFGNVAFPKPMAKVPTVTLYNPNTGTSGQVYGQDGVARGCGANSLNSRGWGEWNFGSTVSSSTVLGHYGHYTADTGW